MISLPSLPAVSAAPKIVPQQQANAASSTDGSKTFAHYLKSLQGGATGEETDGKSAAAKLTAGAKDKSGKDSKKSSDDKKKPLLSDAIAVPVNVAMASEAKQFRLQWPRVSSETKNGGDAAAQETGEGKDLKPDALKDSVAAAVSNAPVAFGATLSKADVLRADGLKTGAAEAQPNTKAGETASAKASSEVAKPAESKSSSGKQEEQHSDSSSKEEQSAASSGNSVKPVSATASGTQGEALAGIHAAVPSSSSETGSAGAATVQNAYAPVQPAPPVNKTAAAAAATEVAEPVQTPSVRPQNIDLKITGADNNQVDVRVSQRAGDVQVTVRTPDGDLAQSLRQHLPELSERLSQAGVSGELWQPQTAQTANNGGNNSDARYSDDAQTQQQQSQQQQGQSRQNSQGDGRQSEGDAAQPAWFNEFNQANKESR